jgi:hypothetical protein
MNERIKRTGWISSKIEGFFGLKMVPIPSGAGPQNLGSFGIDQFSLSVLILKVFSLGIQRTLVVLVMSIPVISDIESSIDGFNTGKDVFSPSGSSPPGPPGNSPPGSSGNSPPEPPEPPGPPGNSPPEPSGTSTFLLSMIMKDPIATIDIARIAITGIL